jgi:hypothetical protein
MAEESPQARRGRGARTAGIVIVLAAVAIVLLGPRLYKKFEEPPVVGVADILRGNVQSDIVMVRGIVQRERGEQGHIFLGDLDEQGEIVVDGISMLPVVRVESWAWFDAGQEVRLPVMISKDPNGNLLLIEVRRRGETRPRQNIQTPAPEQEPDTT